MFYDEQIDPNDPDEILRRALESLQGQNSSQQRLRALAESQLQGLNTQEDPNVVAQRRLLQQAGSFDPVKQFEEAAPEQSNTMLDEVRRRLSLTTPLDKMAQMRPEDYVPKINMPKSKWGKVLAGIGSPLIAMGYAQQVGPNADKEAFDKFMKVQEAYRKDRATDFQAANAASNTTAKQNISTQQIYSKLIGLQGKNTHDTLKDLNEILKTSLGERKLAALEKQWEDTDDNTKERIKLEYKKQAEAIPNGFVFGAKMAQMLQEGKGTEAYLMLSAFAEQEKIKGAAASLKNQGTTTSSGSKPSYKWIIGPNGLPEQVPGDPQPWTSQKFAQPNPEAAAINNKYGLPKPNMGQPMSMQPPQQQQMPQAAPGVSQAQRVPKPAPASFAAPEEKTAADSKINDKWFRLKNTMSNIPEGSAATAQIKNEMDQRKNQAESTVTLVDRMVRGIATGKIFDVMGAEKQPLEIIGRLVEEIKTPGFDFGPHLQGIYNKATGRSKMDPEALNLREDFTKKRIDYVAAKIFEVSGKAATDTERKFLSEYISQLSDEPVTATHNMFKIAAWAAIASRWEQLNLPVRSPQISNEIEKTIKELANETINNAQALTGLSRAGKKIDIPDTAAILNPDRIIYVALKKSGALGMFPMLGFGGPAETSKQKLEKKLKQDRVSKSLKLVGVPE